jgi:succinate dehydrogenase/fumarate reductase flavoprotein subunit
LRPGVTFTYLGLHTDDTAVRFGDRPSANLFVAGEMMAGNVLGKGYTAGVGMSIGTAFGRIAGTQAAAAAWASRSQQREHRRKRPCRSYEIGASQQRFGPGTRRPGALANGDRRAARPPKPKWRARCRSAMPAATAKASAPCSRP